LRGIWGVLFFFLFTLNSFGALLPLGDFVDKKHFLDLKLLYGCRPIARFKNSLSPKACRFDPLIVSREFNLPQLYDAVALLDKDGTVHGVMVKLSPVDLDGVVSELSLKYNFEGCIAPRYSYYNRCTLVSPDGRVKVVVERYGRRVSVLFVRRVLWSEFLRDKRKGRLGGRP